MVTDSASSKSKFVLPNVLLAHSLEDLGHTVVGVRPLELKVKVSASEVRVANLASRNREISFGIYKCDFSNTQHQYLTQAGSPASYSREHCHFPRCTPELLWDTSCISSESFLSACHQRLSQNRAH